MADSEPQACEDRRGTHQGAEKQQLRQHLEDFRPGGTERAAVLAPQFICPGTSPAFLHWGETSDCCVQTVGGHQHSLMFLPNPGSL